MARIHDAYRPYGVVQIKDWGCWAACMESWTSTVFYWETRLYADFAKVYGGAQDSLDTASSHFRKLVEDYSLNPYIFDPGALNMSSVHCSLTKQRDCGRFSMIIEQLTPTTSHARLIYNVDIDKFCIDVMEPRTGGFTTLYQSSLKKTMLLTPVAIS